VSFIHLEAALFAEFPVINDLLALKPMQADVDARVAFKPICGSCESSCGNSLVALRVRLHRLKMRGKKRIPVLTLAQHLGSTCGDECGIPHAKKTEHRSQIWLDKIERGHLHLGVVDAAGCDDEGRLLAEKQALRCSVGVGKRSAHTANLVDPSLEH